MTRADARATEPKPAAKGASRTGGLLVPPKDEQRAVFAVILTVGLASLLLTVFLPFLATTGTESPWCSTGRIGFLGAAVLSGVVFGSLAAIVAERRNHSPWWYLAGQLGVVLAPVLAHAGLAEESPLLARLLVFGVGMIGTLGAFLYIQSAPRTEPAAAGAFAHAAARFFYRVGNTWFGIVLLVILIGFLIVGTEWENRHGHKSVHHVIYTSWWFGLHLLLSAVSMISATLKKFPWRFDQVGWIVVHISLVIIVVGSYLTFWGKVEGELELNEGERSAVFDLATETRLVVDEVKGQRWVKVWDTLADFDLNPARYDGFERAYMVKDGPEDLFEVTVDRYYAAADTRTVVYNDNPERALALFGELHVQGEKPREFSLTSTRDQVTLMNMFRMGLATAINDLSVEAWKGGRDLDGKGKVIFKSKDGTELHRISVSMPAGKLAGQDPDEQLPLEFTTEIPGTGIKATGLHWNRNAEIRGVELGPALQLRLAGPKGEEIRPAAAYGGRISELWAERPETLYKDVRVELDYVPPRPMHARTLTFVQPFRGEMFWVYQSATEERRTGPVIPGEFVDTPTPAFRIKMKDVYDHYREQHLVDRVGKEASAQFIRLRVGDEKIGPTEQERWLFLGGRTSRWWGASFVSKGDRTFRIRWVKTQAPLGFDLLLHDFRRDFYPGSTQERTFESYLRLTDVERFPSGVNIKVDMNHPLRFRGWRLFQSRFSTAEGEMTILQVNRDPGLPVTYTGCALLVLGLVIVFFQKRPFLFACARWLRRRDASPQAQLTLALGVVFLCFLGTVPGLMIIAFLPEGPAQGVGVLVILLGLVVESLVVNFMVARRLDAQPDSPAAGGLS